MPNYILPLRINQMLWYKRSLRTDKVLLISHAAELLLSPQFSVFSTLERKCFKRTSPNHSSAYSQNQNWNRNPNPNMYLQKVTKQNAETTDRFTKCTLKKNQRQRERDIHRWGPNPPSVVRESKSDPERRVLRSASVSWRKPRPLVFLGPASEEDAPPVMADLSLGRGGAWGEAEASASAPPSSSIKSSSSGSKSTASPSAAAPCITVSFFSLNL